MALPPSPFREQPPHHPESQHLSRGVHRCLLLANRLAGIVYRATSVRRANPEDLIAGAGTQITGGRWTPPRAFRAVYASREISTALDEASQQNIRHGAPSWMAFPLVVTALDVDLEPVLDLTQVNPDRLPPAPK